MGEAFKSIEPVWADYEDMEVECGNYASLEEAEEGERKLRVEKFEKAKATHKSKYNYQGNKAFNALMERLEAKRQEEAMKNPKDGFEAFWGVYPKRKNKQDAKRAFDKCIKSGVSVENLVKYTGMFAKQRKAETIKKPGSEQFTPYPASWLNKGGYSEFEEAVR